MADAHIHAEIDDKGLAELFSRETAQLADHLRQTREQVGEDAEIIFAGYALKGRTMRLSRGIRAISAGDEVLVTAHARNPENGFDYVGVTRFGHTVDRIYPVKAKALKLPWGFFASVKGFKPKSDWAEDALPDIEAEGQAELRDLGRGIVARLSV